MKNTSSSETVYDIGIDIGTNSVGWSVVGDNARMLRFKGKNMWGVRLLDQTQTAAERRVFRSMRRRISRRRQRVLDLQSLLAEDVLKVDESFFHRLDESALVQGDKQLTDKGFGLPGHVFESEKGKSAHLIYPTIYHLRKALCTKDEKADIRYVYLALHHIVKYRGNFLYEGQKVSSFNEDIGTVMAESLSLVLGEEYADELSEELLSEAADIIKDTKKTRPEKVSALLALLPNDKSQKPALDAWAKALLGMTFVWEKLVQADVAAEDQFKTDLTKETAEEELLEHDPENAELIALLMQLYRWGVFSKLRKNNETLSESMVRKYGEHKQDLIILKRLVRKHFPQSYKDLFKSTDTKAINYHAYCKQSGECTKDKFFTYLKKLLGSKAKELAENPDYLHIMQRMGTQNEGDFLYLQRNRDNGVIPNQFQAEELSLILEKQGKYHPSLLQEKDKIYAICTFRIPYHVGPLNPHSPFGWMERKEEGAIKPWNFKDKVDVQKSAEGFMAKLTSTCTYLPTERVLPRFSPLYQEYCLLDELNKARIIFRDGISRFFSVPEKKKIIKDLFLQHKKVTKAAAIRWLGAQGVVDIEDILGLRKNDGDAFEGTLSTLIDLQAKSIPTDNQDMLEEIVYWIAIFQDRSIIMDKLKKYPQLSSEQKQWLARRQYKGWGRLSRKLLDGILGVYQNQPMSLIEVMRESNLNFMQIINDPKLYFDKRLEEENKELAQTKNITLDDVRSLPCSPSLHRSIWQTKKIVDEILSIMGHPPRAIYLEVTRDDDPRKKGKRTISRLEKIEKIYKENNLSEPLLQALRERVQADRNITDERLLLYYMQEGKCLYSGKPLVIDALHTYHVDHIVPRSFKKDDSLDNKALITSEANLLKGDSLVVPEVYRRAQRPIWNHLRAVGLMSDSKFRSLIRDKFEPESMIGFINRQLVETSQIIKHITNLIRTSYPDTKVQSIKARLSSDFREQYGLYKLREVNDYHHAHDALLSATLGQFVSKYMAWLEDENQRNRRFRQYRDARPRGTGGMVLGFFRMDHTHPETGELHQAGRSVQYLKDAFFYKDCFITRKCDVDTSSFYNQQASPKSDTLNLYPRKKGLDPKVYGGYATPTTAYMAAIEYTNNRGKRARTLVNVPVLYAASIGNSQEKLIEFLQTGRTPYQQVKVLCPKIPINQLALYDGHPIWLRSASEAWNARQLLLDRQSYAYALCILKGEDKHNSDMTAQAFMDYFIEKLITLYPRYQGIAEKLRNNAAPWDEVDPQTMKTILTQLLRITGASGISGDFANIQQLPDVKNNQGRMTNVNFDLDKLIFIDQSVTGMRERKVRRCYGLSNSGYQNPMQTKL